MHRTNLFIIFCILFAQTAFAAILPTSLGIGVEGIAYKEVSFTSNKTNLKDPSLRWKVLQAPPGITMDQKGRYAGTPTRAGNYTFSVLVYQAVRGRLDLKDSATITHTISATTPPTINSLTLPPGRFDMMYAPYSLTATGGMPVSAGVYTWEALPLGSNEFQNIPQGMALSKSGVLSGVPTSRAPVPQSSRTYTFRARATDSVGKSATANYTLVINPALPPTILGQCPLPDGIEQIKYKDYKMTGSGGKPPYFWTIQPPQNFPAGLKLHYQTGVIYGTPRTYGNFTFQINLVDKNGFSVNKSCSISILPIPHITTNSIFTCATVGKPICAEIEAIGGSTPYRWEILPPLPSNASNITISTSAPSKGMLCGNFSSSSNNTTVTVKVTDNVTSKFTIKSFRFDVRNQLSITSSCPPVEWTSGNPISPILLSAEGGSGNYTWSKFDSINKPWPNGLSISGNRIQGTPVVFTTTNYTIAYQVTDSCGNTANKTCPITVYPAFSCNQTQNLPCLSVKPFILQIVADNDFALFAGNNSSISRMIYQNNTSWGSQVSAASSVNFDLQANEDSFYVLAMNAGGPGDISGKIGATNIADLVENNKIKKSLDISGYLNSYSASAGPIEVGSYNVTLTQAQNARNQLGDSAWATPSINSSNTVITQNPYAYSSKQGRNVGFDLPSYNAVFFRFSGADVSTFPDSVLATVSGGKPPYSWALLPLANTGRTLPDGMIYEISSNGTQLILKGNIKESGTFAFISRVTDSLGNSCSQNHTFTVYPKLEITNTCPLPNGTIGTAYSANLTASGGKSAYSWSLVAPNNVLPPRLTLNSTTGIISGTPTTAGNFTFTYKVSDTCSQNTTNNCTIQIINPCLGLSLLSFTSTTPLDSWFVGEYDEYQFQVKGGLPPYTFQVDQSTLPPGISLDSQGKIFGTPTQVASSSVTPEVSWVQWNAPSSYGNIALGGLKYAKSVTGKIQVPGLGEVAVSLNGEILSQSVFNKNDGGAIWNTSYVNGHVPIPSTYKNTFVPSLPSNSDRISITGYGEPRQTIQFSKQVSNIVMNIRSLGSSGDNAAYLFENNFILTGSDIAPYALNKNGLYLNGKEGYGQILFPGKFLNITWKMPDAEAWNDWNIGVTSAYPNKIKVKVKDFCGSSVEQEFILEVLPFGSSQLSFTSSNGVSAPMVAVNTTTANSILLSSKYLNQIKTEGSLGKTFYVSINEVTLSEYTEFLNSVALLDTNLLYNPLMANIGIQITTANGTNSYTVDTALEDHPVAYVSWFDVARYANWLANGKPTGSQVPTTTENGAYNLASSNIIRNVINPNTGQPPRFWLLNEAEWYASAYLKSDGSALWTYPTQSNSAPEASGSNPVNFANFGGVFGETTPVGFFNQSPGPFGTFDQAGNVREWTETIDSNSGKAMRIIRGGSWADPASAMRADESQIADPSLEDDKTGFRIGGAP